jgi:hypothetical protein
MADARKEFSEADGHGPHGFVDIYKIVKYKAGGVFIFT